MKKLHHYKATTNWTGNKGNGTSSVTGYSRDHDISNEGKPVLQLTTDNKAVGDPSRLNPEDLLVSAIASCHMLSYLYLCSMEGVVITSYKDETTGIMEEKLSGGGQFLEVTLHPVCTVADASMIEKAIHLHHKANEICYIANSVNFPVKHEPTCSVG